jgi:ABC-type molybdate transport system permease subunit
MISLLAGIPSVVFGLWGLTVLVPLIGQWQPPGASLLAAVLILAMMTLPTVALTSRAALAATPPSLYQGAAMLGMSRHRILLGVLVPAARRGILGGVLLAIARALGETMAVLMVAGNVVQTPTSLFDPIRVLTANIALEMAYAVDQHRSSLFVSGLLLMAMVHTLFDEDLVDLGHAANWTKDVDLIRLASLGFRPEAVSGHTGLSAEDIRGLARQLANTRKAALYSRMGTSTQTFGGIATWLTYVLNILTGKLDATGGVMFTQPAIDTVALGAMAGQQGHIGRRLSRVRKRPEFGGEFPASTMADEMLTPGEEQIRAFVTLAGNPVLSSPNGGRLDEAFSQLDFMVSVDFFLNETTRHADIILPPTGGLERSHYDLIFNLFAVRNTAKYSPALFDAGEDSRHDWQILLELAHRLEKFRAGGRLPLRAEAGWRAFKQIGPDPLVDLMLRCGPYGADIGPARGIVQPAIDLVLDILPGNHPIRGLAKLSPLNRHWQDLPKGLSLRTLTRLPNGVDLGPLRPCMPDRLFTADHKVNLAPRRYLADLDRLNKALQRPTPEDELLLIGRRHLRSNNSWMHNSRRLVKGKDRCTLVISPKDAARAGLQAGDSAEVSTATGRIVLPVDITDDIMPGVVSVPHGWGHDRPGTGQSVAAGNPGASINDIISDQEIDPLAGTSVLNGQTVKVKVWRSDRQRKRA